MTKSLSKLFEPIRVGNMVLKNRIVMTGFAICTPEDTIKAGVVHQLYVDFFEERAKGGVGLIVLPDTVVDPSLRFQCHFCLGADEFNPGFSALTESVHAWGAKIAPDLWHNGYRMEREWQHFTDKDFRPLSSSPLAFGNLVAREMNKEDIDRVENQFAEAALRAKVTGFDAVHFAGHFGFLIAQFMSPRFNKRRDEYGGSLENRMRFPLEIIAKTRARIGNSMPIIFRLSADEFLEGGLRLEDSKAISRILQKAGVDMLNIVAGVDLPDKYHTNVIPMGFPQGPFVELGAQIKRAVDIPVIIVGRITDPVFAEKILEEGKADLVDMTRQLVADPETPRKAAEGRFSDIVPCIGCNVCMKALLQRTVSRCSVNPAVGREKAFSISRAEKSRKVMIVGGGPAGMEAARVAALRGHEVSLYEKERALGGQMTISEKPPHKQEITQYKEYLTGQIKKLEVDVKLGVEVTPDLIRQASPDVVIIATGALPIMPAIRGIKGKNVASAWDVLQGKKTGDTVVIAGGGLVGCETAEYLIEKGTKKVTIVEMLPDIAFDVEKTNRSAMMERFVGYGDKLAIITGATVKSVSRKGLIIEQNGEKKTIPADTVVIALGVEPNNTLGAQLPQIQHVHVIGDSFKPGRIVDAVNNAAYLARQI